MNSEETPHETFNRRFDALFAEDCRNADARLQGKLGMVLVVSYLSKIDWTLDFFMSMSMSIPHLILHITDTHVVLNPREKMGYFKKHWSVDLQGEVMTCAEGLV